jgi:mono/diheme cytochrome c family protein
MSITRMTGATGKHLLALAGLVGLLLCTSLSVKAQDADAGAAAAADGIPTDEEAINAGKSLFTNNCKQCHAIGDVVVGPALKDVHERRPVEWLTAFIKNSQQVIQSGDPYAVNLYNEFNKVQMPSFNFKDEEILSILAYVKAESANAGAPAADTQTTAAAGEAGGQAEAGGIPSSYLTIIIIALFVVLVLVLLVLALVVSVLMKYLNQRTDLDEADKEIIGQRFDMGKAVKSNTFLFLVIFLFTAVLLKTGIDGLYKIGVQQGYMPTQPIAYSHKLHAGTLQINCNYCHTGVYKAKSANIPSANICMNCHNTVKPESPEIQKIYAAVGWDAESKEYIEGYEQQPIKWVRIHNLPDLAYFNHSQHTNVGGIECQTCHGPIQEMDVVYQYSKLTMGWCINCHRDTDVNAEGNEYYDRLVQLHEASNAVGNMKVADIGGLECARCHY